MNKPFFIASLLLISCGVSAQLVSLELAKQRAEQFLHTSLEFVDNATDNDKRAVSPRKSGERDAEDPAIYVFAADSQWAVVSADERTTPILAYSNECAFPSSSEMSPAMHDLLEDYQRQIQFLREHEISQNTDSVSNMAVRNSTSSLPARVSPLLEKGRAHNKWRQDQPYNKFCPSSSDYAQPQVGCVALAMSQIMWYWEWPAATHVTDYANGYLLREYDWSVIPSEITNSTPINEVDMLAHLLADVGQAVNMNYGSDASGTSMIHVPSAFGIFGYHADDSLLRSDFSDNEWKTLLKNELANERPILYGGYGYHDFGAFRVDYGHCFVVDGYDVLDRFHINLGHGDQAAYFYLTNIHEMLGLEKFKYDLNHTAVFNIYPSTWDCEPFYLSKRFWSMPDLGTFQYPAGFTVYNAVVESGITKNITSGDYIRILPGSHFQRGSNVHFSIEETDCDGEYTDLFDNLSPARVSRSLENPNPFDEPVAAKLDVSPNPVHDILNISGCSCESPELMIYSIRGQLVLAALGTSLDVHFLPAGLYLLVCNDNGHITRTRFLKE
ncbi:MAG: thiol protease/hemagglutinin PrtT [Bacteroidales bacterium]|nr:thiol protease/hemagglutinin PrtT [Candidatus Colicola faecequi]